MFRLDELCLSPLLSCRHGDVTSKDMVIGSVGSKCIRFPWVHTVRMYEYVPHRGYGMSTTAIRRPEKNGTAGKQRSATFGKPCRDRAPYKAITESWPSTSMCAVPHRLRKERTRSNQLFANETTHVHTSSDTEVTVIRNGRSALGTYSMETVPRCGTCSLTLIDHVSDQGAQLVQASSRAGMFLPSSKFGPSERSEC